MIKFLRYTLRPACVLSLLAVFYATFFCGGCKLLQLGGRAAGLCDPPSLDSSDPFDRAAAARQAAKRYGGGK